MNCAVLFVVIRVMCPFNAIVNVDNEDSTTSQRNSYSRLTCQQYGNYHIMPAGQSQRTVIHTVDCSQDTYTLRNYK